MEHEKLKKKGWSQQEIDHLKKHYNPVESRFILVLLIISLLIAIIGVPYAYSFLGQVIPSGLFYAILVLIGGLVGCSFAILISDLDRLTNKHHVFLVLCIPLVAIMASFLSFKSISAGIFSHNVYIASVLYTVSLVLAYASIVRIRWNLKKQ